MFAIWQFICAAGAIIGLAFVALYARRLPRWRKSPTAWNLMLFMGAISAVFGLLFLEGMWGPWPRSLWLVIITSVVTLMAHRLGMLVEADLDERRNRVDR